jgi:anti-sigma regulatory factor (Ser/Thr protein kinase)
MSEPESLVRLHFGACADRLRMVRCVVQGAAELSGCARSQADELVLAVNEACMNIIEHAYAGDAAGAIVLEVVADGDRLLFRLTDFAPPVDPGKVQPRDLDDLRPGGLGVHFIREVMDTARFVDPPDGAGNVFEMTKTIRRA